MNYSNNRRNKIPTGLLLLPIEVYNTGNSLYLPELPVKEPWDPQTTRAVVTAVGLSSQMQGKALLLKTTPI